MTHAPLLALCPAHQQHLATSAISDAIITERGYCSIAPGSVHDWRQLAGPIHSDKLLKRVLHGGALAFPIYRLGNATPYTWVLRPEQPRTNSAGSVIKYEWPARTGNVFDVLPRYQTALGDPNIPIWITEGAKKADALASAYGMAIIPINLNGVFGWRGRNTQGGTTAIADLEMIAWDGRRVILAPDGDVKFNKQVFLAVDRLAKLLTGRYGVAGVCILRLPMGPQDPKIGVDDYLAQGHTSQELEQLLDSVGGVSSTPRVAFGAHPDTGAKLFLPPGYDVQHETIVQVDRHGTPRPVYSGAIFVKEIGVELATREHTATIAWNGRGNTHGEVTIPYAALSDSRAFSSLAGGAGAAIHPRNIRDVQALLVEFAQENITVLPRRAHVDRLGLVNGGLVLPAGAIGFIEEVRYTGRPAITVGTALDAYPTAIRTALTWPNAWAFWLILGLSLASPAVARLRPRRNPVLFCSGASGSGKTTACQFAIGCWGAPARHPFHMEAGRTTVAGIYQTLEHLNGLPLLIDEAHTVPEPKKVEQACYSFANGQRYTVGGADQRARGGTELVGTLLMAGEAVPEFKHAGARLRVLWADAGAWPPLGAEPRSLEGQGRAQLLEATWKSGAGLFGLDVARRMWADWPAFLANVRELERDEALAPLQAWREPLAIAAAALNIAFQVAGVTPAHLPDPTAWAGQLLDAWATMLTSGHDETDPATDAWEALTAMLAQGRKRDDGVDDPAGGRKVAATWEWIEADRGGGVIACRKPGDNYWRVLTRTPQFVERVGAQAVQLHGQAWIKRGWVQAAPDGKATHYKRVYGSSDTETSARVLCIPMKMLTCWGDVAP